MKTGLEGALRTFAAGLILAPSLALSSPNTEPEVTPSSKLAAPVSLFGYDSDGNVLRSDYKTTAPPYLASKIDSLHIVKEKPTIKTVFAFAGMGAVLTGGIVLLSKKPHSKTNTNYGLALTVLPSVMLASDSVKVMKNRDLEQRMARGNSEIRAYNAQVAKRNSEIMESREDAKRRKLDIFDAIGDLKKRIDAITCTNERCELVKERYSSMLWALRNEPISYEQLEELFGELEEPAEQFADNPKSGKVLSAGIEFTNANLSTYRRLRTESPD